MQILSLLKMDNITKSQQVKLLAKAEGFDFCGIAKAEKLDKEARLLEQWLHKGYQGKMSYLENWFDKRIDPTLLVEGSKSVICLLYNYTPKNTLDISSFKLSKYAYNEDYHVVIKNKLNHLFQQIILKFGAVEGRVFVDSAPVMERAWAQRTGLGWLGKHTLLINKDKGSFYFIATIICDLELAPDTPYSKDYCGTCTKCIDACPTDAIVQGNIVDASKCISYLTIELKDELLPNEFKGKFDDWIFGCDICQDVCPWNKFATPHQEPKFEPTDALKNMTKSDWKDLNEDMFNVMFNHTPLKRTKFKGIRRNIDFLCNKN